VWTGGAVYGFFKFPNLPRLQNRKSPESLRRFFVQGLLKHVGAGKTRSAFGRNRGRRLDAPAAVRTDFARCFPRLDF